MTRHVTSAVLQTAESDLEVQALVDELRAGTATPAKAWLLFCEAAATNGWKSAKCRALVVQLAKRAAERRD